MTLDEYLLNVQDTACYQAAILRTYDADRLQIQAKEQLEKYHAIDSLFPLDHPHMTGAELSAFKQLAQTLLHDLQDKIEDTIFSYENEDDRDINDRLDEFKSKIDQTILAFDELPFKQLLITSAKDAYAVRHGRPKAEADSPR